jgi:hypothetical protein
MHTIFTYACIQTYTPYRCPPSVCLGNSTCVEGHEGPICSLCASGYAFQSGRCVQCGNLGVWPQIIAAILAFVVFVFIFFFSWFPLLPDWLQNKLSPATALVSSKTEEPVCSNQDNNNDGQQAPPASFGASTPKQADATDDVTSAKAASTLHLVVQHTVDATLNVFGDNIRDYFKILIGFW